MKLKSHNLDEDIEIFHDAGHIIIDQENTKYTYVSAHFNVKVAGEKYKTLWVNKFVVVEMILKKEEQQHMEAHTWLV